MYWKKKTPGRNSWHCGMLGHAHLCKGELCATWIRCHSFNVLLIHLIHALLHVVLRECFLGNFRFPRLSTYKGTGLQATASSPRLWVTASLGFGSSALGQLALLSPRKAALNTICLSLLLNSCSTLTMPCSTTQIPGRDVMASPLWPVYDREDK